MGLNTILDPALPGADCHRDRWSKVTHVSKRWAKTTVSEALRVLLKENQLILVTNPVTTVARIAPGSVAVRPVTMADIGNDLGNATTNSVVPLIVVNDVPLLNVLEHMGRQAGRTMFFDPAVKSAFDEGSEIHLRWEDLTARQALAAVLDNYGLVMFENVAAGTAMIRFRGKR